jgi:deoxyadenosine/deoxycytidine kinase
MASRFQQLKDQLSNLDLFHDFIIADYFIVKSLIFARKTLPADELALFTRFFNFISITLPKPEILVYLYLNVDRLQQNIRKRGRSYEQQIKDEYLEKIQAGYFEHFKQQKDLRVLILDTNNIDFVQSEQDYQQVLKAIDQQYEPGVHRITF